MSEIKTFHQGVRMSKACVVLLVAASALAQTGRATDYERLTSSDPDNNNSSFLQGNRWSDKQVPHGDADYIVTNNFLLRAPYYNNKPETNYVFGGRSLAIGKPGDSVDANKGRLSLGAANGGRTTVDNLILVKGQLRVVAASLTTPLYGNITVESPASAPFAVQSANGNRTMRIYSSISGAEGTGLLFSGDDARSACTTSLHGNNSNYLGSFTICGSVSNTLTFANVTGVTGGDPSTYTPRGIVVKDGATLRLPGTTVSYANRGIYVESTGGVLRQDGANSYLRLPLAGDVGATLVKTGPEQAAFYGTWTNVTVDVREGTFALGTGISTPGEGARVIVSGGTFSMRGETAPNLPISMSSGFISPYGTASGDLVLSNATVTGGGVLINYDYANNRCDSLTLDEGCTFGAETFAVDLANLPNAGDTNRYPVLVVPDSVCHLTMDKLALSFSEVDESFYPACLKAELEAADGVNTLYISRTNSVVYFVQNQVSGNNAATWNWRTPSYWSDGVGLLDGDNWRTGVDFLISGMKANNSASEYFAARTPNNNNVEQFRGRSLTIVGSRTKTGRVLIKSLALVGADIRLGANGWICGAAAATQTLTQYVTGTVTVAESATRDRPAIFSTTGNRTFEVRAELKGTGVTGVSATTVNGISKVVFTRTNPEFRGKFVVKTNYTNDTEVAAGAANMFITSEGCLGPAPDEPTPDAVEVWTGGWFGAAVNDVTLDDPTRGITFQHQSGVVAASGTTFTVKAPLTLKGSFFKTGAGDVVLDSTNVVLTTTGGIKVEGSGCLQVNKPDMFWGYSRFRFDRDNKAALLFPRVPANEESGTYGIAMNTSNQCPFVDLSNAAHSYLPVKIAVGDTPPTSAFRVALCSVTPAAANVLRGQIDVLTSVKGFKCNIVEDDVTYKDTALKRFTAVFSLKGMCIMFR